MDHEGLYTICLHRLRRPSVQIPWIPYPGSLTPQCSIPCFSTKDEGRCPIPNTTHVLYTAFFFSISRSLFCFWSLGKSFFFLGCFSLLLLQAFFITVSVYKEMWDGILPFRDEGYNGLHLFCFQFSILLSYIKFFIEYATMNADSLCWSWRLQAR